MQYIVKFFSEIAIKSTPVRRKFIRALVKNLREVLTPIDPNVAIHRDWDKLRIETTLCDTHALAQLEDAMCHTSGITYILEVVEHPLPPIDELVDYVLPVYQERLAGRTFAVRCKRSGKHSFTSIDVEREVGGALLQQSQAAGVQLKSPDVTVEFEIIGESVFVIGRRMRGLGGYPVGSVDPVLSLLSGGFDSPVASYMTMKRGMRTHFLFFNLGGIDHEIGVKEVALYLWQKYGCNQKVLFISVPFEEVVAQLLKNVQDSQMGVVLKRMMLRVANRVAEDLDIDALVTGECVAQVSSQTVRNLAVIDRVTERVVLRPLIASDKEDIVRMAAQIGTHDFAASMPEYCGVISVRPTTRATLERIEAQEAKFDFDVLDRAFENRVQSRIDQLANEELVRAEVEVLSVPLSGCTIIDIRHPDEQELAPLKVHQQVLNIPFYELHAKGAALDPSVMYMLYCGKGVMSRLHASHLQAQGDLQVKVYAPSA